MYKPNLQLKLQEVRSEERRLLLSRLDRGNKEQSGEPFVLYIYSHHNPPHVPDAAQFITERSTVVPVGLETAAVCPCQ